MSRRFAYQRRAAYGSDRFEIKFPSTSFFFWFLYCWERNWIMDVFWRGGKKGKRDPLMYIDGGGFFFIRENDTLRDRVPFTTLMRLFSRTRREISTPSNTKINEIFCQRHLSSVLLYQAVLLITSPVLFPSAHKERKSYKLCDQLLFTRTGEKAKLFSFLLSKDAERWFRGGEWSATVF